MIFLEVIAKIRQTKEIAADSRQKTIENVKITIENSVIILLLLIFRWTRANNKEWRKKCFGITPCGKIETKTMKNTINKGKTIKSIVFDNISITKQHPSTSFL